MRRILPHGRSCLLLAAALLLPASTLAFVSQAPLSLKLPSQSLPPCTDENQQVSSIPIRPPIQWYLRRRLGNRSLHSSGLFSMSPVSAIVSSPTTQVVMNWKNLAAAWSLLLMTTGVGLTFVSGMPQLAIAILKASLRSTLQLAFVGCLLTKLFAISNGGLVLTWIVVTGLFAAQEASSRLDYSYDRLTRHLALAILTGGGMVLAFSSLFCVFGNLSTRLDPRIWIPITGMIFGNSLTTTALAAQSLTTTLKTQQELIEFKLCQGATIREALSEFLRRIYQTSLTPVLNFLAAAGIIHIPGMMTGQILAGQKPLQAAAYQLVIFFLIASTSVATVQLLVRLGIGHLTDQPNQRLRSNLLYAVDKANIKSQQKDLLCLLQKLNPLRHRKRPETTTATTTTTKQVKVVQEVYLDRSGIGDNDSKNIVLSVDKMHVPRANVNLSMRVCHGDRIAITGRSGIGKSQVLRTLIGLEEDETASPHAALFDVPLSQMSMAEWRSHVVLVPQERPSLEGTPNELYSKTSGFSTQRAKFNGFAGHKITPADYIVPWEVEAEALNKPWSDLSGGESQRVLLAIALALRPDVLLLDEALNALDEETSMKVESTLKELGIPLVMVSHSNAQIERFCTGRIHLESSKE